MKIGAVGVKLTGILPPVVRFFFLKFLMTTPVVALLPTKNRIPELLDFNLGRTYMGLGGRRSKKESTKIAIRRPKRGTQITKQKM